ncbi:GT4 family glycosyltransferase PelF [Paenibacillus sp. CF384]|uniref:GT4 family glycosyltransferase PelF n=1 Tax=Paenibacillus sp. CF384 TaxID=1884382 RepID=UPI000898BA15|nr:GT4 family glycosyltransferase PelF [Paenibacillus sp. CF384]SDW66363.1 Glycosyltransferase involved in cell wall bisynthesis [Paenibacillus sp. CF384]
MRICLVAEGSYPYITGGVSSWIHALIRNMPEHEFVIYAIAAERKQKGKFKYELPSNLVEVHEGFLDDFLRIDGEWGHRVRLDKEEKAALKSLIGGDEHIDWKPVLSVLGDPKLKNAADFLMSKDYFDIMSELCLEKYRQIPFTEMFWTVRSMILPLLLTVRATLPEADIYHSVSTGYAGVIASLGKHKYQKPMILTEHGIYSREREEEIIKADWVKGYFKDVWIEYFYTLSACAYQYADQVITLFNRNKEIQIELGCAEEKIQIMPNGVGVDDFNSLPTKPEGEPMWIGGLVRVVPIKDIKTMIQSFQIVKYEVPDAKFFIMGPYEEDLEYYQECLSLVESLQLKDVIFTGSVNIKDYIGKMDVLVLSSISEGQPLAVLEGMAAGKPFVTTDVGSCKELLFGVDDDYGSAGYVVPVMNYEQIGQAVITLCRSERQRREMGANGLERVRNRYTNAAFINNYKNLYRSYGEEKR